MSRSLDAVARAARDCTICAAHLPLGPRPVFRVSASARLLIVGQAPGTKVHESGIPWNDASGERLRDWLRLDRERFYDECRVAIVPMGFCYPGTDTRGGDRPPRRECAPTWHRLLLGLMPEIRLTLLVGSYAQARYLDAARKGSLTDTVRAFRDYTPRHLPLPHPSWRNTGWLKRNAWFEAELLPYLRRRVAAVLRD
jgi:uracil-DNA glycosylase